MPWSNAAHIPSWPEANLEAYTNTRTKVNDTWQFCSLNLSSLCKTSKNHRQFCGYLSTEQSMKHDSVCAMSYPAWGLSAVVSVVTEDTEVADVVVVEVHNPFACSPAPKLWLVITYGRFWMLNFTLPVPGASVGLDRFIIYCAINLPIIL